IVYTPQPIVDFMVKSVNEILDKEFGKSLTSKGVHFLDPFVGTGNFMVRLMREIASKGRMALSYKYKNELHCNEVMLLPYYIASMNIEHEFLDLMGKYQPFEGICLADTFELAEDNQVKMFAPENTERVKKQQGTEFFVIIGNPPYNVGQINENDNNKNHKYPVIDGRVKETYAKDSKATNKNALADPYVKAIRWASDRIGEEGIVVFVTNNGFLDNIAFDGMRKHLGQDFSKLYILDLGGNVRKNPGKTSNVFDIRVGVSINLLVKSSSPEKSIYYAHVGDELSKEQKLNYLIGRNLAGVDWQVISPNDESVWLTEGLHSEFDEFLPLGTKEAKKAKDGDGIVFKTYGLGIATHRDAWAYNFNQKVLAENMQRTIDVYNEQVNKWQDWLKNDKNHAIFAKLKKNEQNAKIDDFVLYDDSRISWGETLKTFLKRGKVAEFNSQQIRESLYRPFIKSHLFFDRLFNERVYVFPSIFPIPTTENENQVICLAGVGDRKGFGCLISNLIPSLDLAFEKTQCFPFYTYNEDGTNRQENITDWTLNHFQQHYQDNTITKWAIFHYVYGLLHHPDYREKYAANLKRELPRLPMTPDFWAFSTSGEKLAELHLNYEDATPYPLKAIENPKVPFSLNLEK
ncbi:type ISP restriction/modification enzyme, partial [Candidatus Parabeggiatoa sp. HSG14]|uniref:type ISP restriction/modification enzyme n=1 Tax=Candidatus Parabeggiatoa sp. HSG14 TaxID=3055593 RepID=UPI0025A6E349|nr:N-6 DNA methylase [Thiotrichales bacterium HSG14]